MPVPEKLSIAVCIASFNRCDKTRACLTALRTVDLPPGASLQVYLLDDASSDGTAQMVRTDFPEVTLFESKGDLWWAGGMRVAYGAALAAGHDFYIWMNDDVDPSKDSVVQLLATYNERVATLGGEHLISGAMKERSTGIITYGGHRLRNRFVPSGIRKVLPSASEPVEVDLVNGNMLLIPGTIAQRIGNIPNAFVQTLADFDYGLRARKLGARLWLAPGYVGYCDPNVPGRRRWVGEGLSLRERYKRMLHPLGLQFGPRAYYLRQHFPWTAPIYMFSPYIKMPFDHFRGRLERH